MWVNVCWSAPSVHACALCRHAEHLALLFRQAMKRLLTFMQRAHPTDPSRSVDFDGFRDVAKGAIGAGSDKLVCAALSSNCDPQQKTGQPQPRGQSQLSALG